MQITYLSHSCFLVETGSHRLILDPYLSGNPLAPVRAESLDVDFVLCTHGHEDHTADALGLAKRCDATILGPYELAEYFAAYGAKTHGLNPGGAFDFPFGRLKLTIAHHSSSLGDPKHPIYLGNPCGLLLTAENKTIYHAGDTALFLDMQLIGRHGLDLALLPIGDNFTMGIDDAVASLDFLKPKCAVPMHYNTFPPIRQDPQVFVQKAAALGFAARALAPGESITL